MVCSNDVYGNGWGWKIGRQLQSTRQKGRDQARLQANRIQEEAFDPIPPIPHKGLYKRATLKQPRELFLRIVCQSAYHGLSTRFWNIAGLTINPKHALAARQRSWRALRRHKNLKYEDIMLLRTARHRTGLSTTGCDIIAAYRRTRQLPNLVRIIFLLREAADDLMWLHAPRLLMFAMRTRLQFRWRQLQDFASEDAGNCQRS